MELSLHLRRKGQEDAWKFVMSTDVGKENMDAIRTHARALIERSTQQVGKNQAEISQSLLLSRMGIALVTAVGLLAFYMYLRQRNALQLATEREQVLLEQRTCAPGRAGARAHRLADRTGQPPAAGARGRARSPGTRTAR